MDIQNIMRQAQKLQQEMLKAKTEIDKKVFPGKYSFVEVEINGKKEILKIVIDKNVKLTTEDIEMLEDILVVALNDALKKVDAEVNEKLGKYSNGIPGLF
jgi:DNA-binding YbaB/EbfC family protein